MDVESTRAWLVDSGAVLCTGVVELAVETCLVGKQDEVCIEAEEEVVDFCRLQLGENVFPAEGYD